MIKILSGSNELGIKEALRDIISEFSVEYGDINIERIDSDDVFESSIIDSLNSVPFLAAKKLVIITNAKKEFLEKVPDLDISDQVEVIIVLERPDKRTSYYKRLLKMPGFKSFDQLDSRDLPKWIVNRTQNHGAKISTNDARYLINLVGEDQIMLSNELEKLVAYSQNINKSSIDYLVEPIPQSNMFQLLEAAFSGYGKNAEKIYNDQRMQKVEPQAIMGMITWQLHILAVIKFSKMSNYREIAKESKISPFVIQKSQVIANKLSEHELKNLISEALKADRKIKSSNANPDLVIKHYLLKIAIS